MWPFEAGLQPGFERRIKLGKFQWPELGIIQWPVTRGRINWRRLLRPVTREIGDERDPSAVETEALLKRQPINAARKRRSPRAIRLRRDHADACTCHPHPIKDRWLGPQSHQTAGKHHRFTTGVPQAPDTVSNVCDAVAALDLECHTKARAQPLLIKHHRCAVIGRERDRTALRALAELPTLTVAEDLPVSQLAIRAERHRSAHHRRPDRRPQQRASPHLTPRERHPKYR
jgi:hypothetical protein